jgi:predicted phage tail protein
MATNYGYITSIHGRRLALDKDDNLVGPEGFRQRLHEATASTTGTAIPNSGVATVTTSTNDGWTLTDPVLGCQIHLMTGSTSTGTHTVTPAAATILSSIGAAGSAIALKGGGAAISLIGLSTSLWGVTSITSSATAEISS